MTEYPHQDGDFTVIGPECFASDDGSVICWKGVNYVPVPVRESTTDGFRIGDLVEIHPPKRHRRKTTPLRGCITTVWNHKGKNKGKIQPGVLDDEGKHWNALDSWLTRIEG